MENENLDDRLRKYELEQQDNWQNISFILRRVHDIWSHKNVSADWGQIKLSYWPVICHISVDGNTAADLSRKSFVVKQNMSRTIKELEDKGLIISETSKKDKRSERLKLTQMGKELVCESMGKVTDLSEEYKKLVGDADLAIAVKVINRIIDYHVKLNEADSEDASLD